MNTKIIMLFLSSPPVFSDVRVAQSLVLCVMFCRPLFVLFFSIVLFVFRFTTTDYSLGIFKLFVHQFC